MRRLRIGLVAPGIPRSATGPAFWIKELSAGLCDAGHEVTVIAGDAPVRRDKPDPTVGIDRRARVVLFPARFHLQRRLHYNPSLKRWLWDNIGGFDVVDIQGVWSFVAAHAAHACISASVPYILTPHGQMAAWDWNKKYWPKRAFFELVIRDVWRAAPAIRFVSHGEMERSQVSPGERGTVIPYWVSLDPNRLGRGPNASVKAQIGIPESSPLVIFFGRISAQKGVLEIVLAFDRLWRRRPTLFLAIVGPQDGSYGAQVLHTIAGLPCKSNIRVLRPVYDQRKYDLLSVASLFITLSKNEGLPITVLEAMACGVPVVITAQANIPEVGLYGAGRIVPNEPGAVATALEALLEDPADLQRMSERARRLVAERFSRTVVLPELVALYERVGTNSFSRAAGSAPGSEEARGTSVEG